MSNVIGLTEAAYIVYGTLSLLALIGLGCLAEWIGERR